MKKQLLVISSLALILGACEHSKGSATGQAPNRFSDETTRTGEERVLGQGGQGTVSDRFARTANEQADRDLLEQVRLVIVNDNSLSPNARTIRIITRNGVVTIRGVVLNEREKNEIAKRIRNINGVKGVENLLEISGNIPQEQMNQQPTSTSFNRQ